jgi:hypothetical protein
MPTLLVAHMVVPFLAALVVLGMVVLAKNGVPDWKEVYLAYSSSATGGAHA